MNLTLTNGNKQWIYKTDQAWSLSMEKTWNEEDIKKDNSGNLKYENP